MSVLPQSVQKVIEHFEKLPGVGPKSASRMVYYFLRNPNKEATNLADSLKEMDQKVKQCQHCYNISESEICNICNSPLRDKKKLCIVEEPLDVVAFENSAVFDGVYFVLGGVISPADGVGADDLRFNQLKARVRSLLKEISEKYCGEKIGLSNDSDGDNNSDNNNNENENENGNENGKVLLNKDIIEINNSGNTMSSATNSKYFAYPIDKKSADNDNDNNENNENNEKWSSKGLKNGNKVTNISESTMMAKTNIVESQKTQNNIPILEIIIATNPSLEGEATASYIKEMFYEEVSKGLVRISQLAMGLPTGADLEYADRLTLKRALEGRN